MCEATALEDLPNREGYEEIGCTESELLSTGSGELKQCCETSAKYGYYACTTCGSCAGTNVANSAAAPAQLLPRVDNRNETCCTDTQNIGILYWRNGTSQGQACDSADVFTDECCKIGEGSNDNYACFQSSTDDKEAPPFPVSDDDVCVCAWISIVNNQNNAGLSQTELVMKLGRYCQEQLLSSAPPTPANIGGGGTSPNPTLKPTPSLAIHCAARPPKDCRAQPQCQHSQGSCIPIP